METTELRNQIKENVLTPKENLEKFLDRIGLTIGNVNGVYPFYHSDNIQNIIFYGKKIMPMEGCERKAYGFYVKDGRYTFIPELVDIKLILTCYGYEIIRWDDDDNDLPENEWYLAYNGEFISNISDFANSPYGSVDEYHVLAEDEMDNNMPALDAFMDYIPPVDERVYDAVNEIENAVRENRLREYLETSIIDIDFMINSETGYCGGDINLCDMLTIEMNGDVTGYDPNYGDEYSMELSDSAVKACKEYARNRFLEMTA